jgi:hypothetical protein
MLRVVTLQLIVYPINSDHLYHLTLLTGSGDLLALIICFRRRWSICRNMAAVHTITKEGKYYTTHWKKNGIIFKYQHWHI